MLAGSAALAADALPRFTDVTEEAGLDFHHRFGDFELTNIVEATGGGAMWFDYDGDGNLDIYLVNGAWTDTVNDNRGRELRGRTENRLFRNQGDGTFIDVTRKAGVGDRRFSFGCSAADYDDDGDRDLLVLNYGRNTFYRNNGDGTFTDVTDESGLGDPHWSLSAPWLDYDNDGDLDVYVANYLAYDAGEFRAYYPADGYPGPLAYSGLQDRLYRNNGDGTFTDVTREAGFIQPNGRAMSATAADFNDDGFLDLYVANDAMENYYFENTGKGTFVEKGMLVGLAFGEHGQGVSSMGPFVGDVDRNGRVDVFIPDMGYGSLLVRDGEIFTDQITQRRVAVAIGQYTSWSGLLLDYDNDGHLDLFLTTGNAHHEYTEEDVLLRNDGKGAFVDVSRASGAYFDTKHVGRGAAYGDYDNDGDLDLLISNLNSPARLLRNDGGNRNGFLVVDARRSQKGAEAIGARVTVTTGTLRQVQDLVPVRGYLSQMDPRLHFGLGTATKADQVEIRWPGGAVETLKNVPANQFVTVTQEKR
jgi:hypothetical protein